MLPRITAVVIHPVDHHVLEAAADARREGLIIPVLIGPQACIRKASQETGTGISSWLCRAQKPWWRKGPACAQSGACRTPVDSTSPCITSPLEQIGSVAVFMASPLASGISGQVVHIDNRFTAIG